MNQTELPSKGTCFVQHDKEYEIQYVHADRVRYSSINGGKTYTITVAQYQAMLANSLAVITHQAKLLIHEGNVKKVARRMRYVTALLTCGGSYLRKRWMEITIKRIAEELGDLLPPSYESARRWIRDFRKKGQAGLVPIVKGNSVARFDAETEMIVAEEIEAARQSGFVIIGVEVHCLVVNRLITQANELGITQVRIPSVRLIQRRIAELDPYHRLIAQHGKEQANRMIRASGQKVIVPYPMSVVQIDTHYLDVIVIDADTFEPIGRPYLVLIVCVKTKKIVGYYISLFPPCATTTLQATKMMLEQIGCPALIIPDRGVEFINSALFHLCGELSITLELSQVREPNHKANVESLFKTITKDLIQRLNGTTYSNVLQRGDYDSVENAIFTMDQVSLYVECWVNEVYDLKPHSQTKRAPRSMWDASIADVPMMKLEANEIESLARIPKLLTIHRGQVSAFPDLKYYSHALTEFNGRKVTVLLDEMDLSCVYIKHPDDPSTMIKADSTEPHYTSGLTLNQHDLVREELKALSEAEMAQIGEHRWQLGKARLKDRIRDDALSNKKKKKALNGKKVTDTVLHEKTTQDDHVDVDTTEAETKKKTKNKPKVSNTRTPVYKDNPENAFESVEIDDYEVMEL